MEEHDKDKQEDFTMWGYPLGVGLDEKTALYLLGFMRGMDQTFHLLKHKYPDDFEDLDVMNSFCRAIGGVLSQSLMREGHDEIK